MAGELGSGDDAQHNPLIEMMERVQTAIADLACSEPDRRRLRSLALNIVAEASAGDDADAQLLNELSARLAEEHVALHEMGAVETNSTRELLQELRDVEALRRKLS
jgi:hypothetical protein